MRFIAGLLAGLFIGYIIFNAGIAYATRTYAYSSREVLADWSGYSLTVLNKQLRDIWTAIDAMDKRLTAGSL